jgi:hypothetical protein
MRLRPHENALLCVLALFLRARAPWRWERCTPAVDACTKTAGVAVDDVAHKLAILKHGIALSSAQVVDGPNAMPQAVLVDAGKAKACIVKLSHETAADVAPRHASLASFDVGGDHKLVVQPSTLSETNMKHRATKCTCCSKIFQQDLNRIRTQQIRRARHLHHNPSSVALVN